VGRCGSASRYYNKESRTDSVVSGLVVEEQRIHWILDQETNETTTYRSNNSPHLILQATIGADVDGSTSKKPRNSTVTVKAQQKRAWFEFSLLDLVTAGVGAKGDYTHGVNRNGYQDVGTTGWRCPKCLRERGTVELGASVLIALCCSS